MGVPENDGPPETFVSERFSQIPDDVIGRGKATQTHYIITGLHDLIGKDGIFSAFSELVEDVDMVAARAPESGQVGQVQGGYGRDDDVPIEERGL